MGSNSTSWAKIKCTGGQVPIDETDPKSKCKLPEGNNPGGGGGPIEPPPPAGSCLVLDDNTGAYTIKAVGTGANDCNAEGCNLTSDYTLWTGGSAAVPGSCNCANSGNANEAACNTAVDAATGDANKQTACTGNGGDWTPGTAATPGTCTWKNKGLCERAQDTKVTSPSTITLGSYSLTAGVCSRNAVSAEYEATPTASCLGTPRGTGVTWAGSGSTAASAFTASTTGTCPSKVYGEAGNYLTEGQCDAKADNTATPEITATFTEVPSAGTCSDSAHNGNETACTGASETWTAKGTCSTNETTAGQTNTQCDDLNGGTTVAVVSPWTSGTCKIELP